jgi:hypothetical protein
VTADIDTDGNLAVRNRESFVRVLIALCALGIIAAWMFSPAARVAAGWTGVCLVFGFALLAANESSDFISCETRASSAGRGKRPFGVTAERFHSIK